MQNPVFFPLIENKIKAEGLGGKKGFFNATWNHMQIRKDEAVLLAKLIRP